MTCRKVNAHADKATAGMVTIYPPNPFGVSSFVEHITVTTDKLLSTGNSDQWFEPVNPACITQVAIQYVESTEKEFLEELGCKANSFSDAVRVMGLSHSGICYNWDKNGRLLIADKAISAAKLPAHYDDLYRYFFAIK